MLRLLPSGFQEGGYVPNDYFMEQAIELGETCLEKGDHPVGAVVTRQLVDHTSGTAYERIVGEGRNEIHRLGSPMAHAEHQAIRDAIMEVGHRDFLGESVLYTTHEPCPMCAGLITNTKLQGVVFGTSLEDARQLSAADPDFKWRSNEVDSLAIIRGRQEKGVESQFIIGGFLLEKCRVLLERTKELKDFVPKTQTVEEFMRSCYPEDEEGVRTTTIQLGYEYVGIQPDESV